MAKADPEADPENDPEADPENDPDDEHLKSLIVDTIKEVLPDLLGGDKGGDPTKDPKDPSTSRLVSPRQQEIDAEDMVRRLIGKVKTEEDNAKLLGELAEKLKEEPPRVWRRIEKIMGWSE